MSNRRVKSSVNNESLNKILNKLVSSIMGTNTCYLIIL